MPSKTGKRASDKGFLEMSFELYLKLLDWTGRQIRRDTKGRIPAELAPIMEADFAFRSSGGKGLPLPVSMPVSPSK